MNYVYVTLLSSKDYLPAILILNQSLKNVNSQFPLVVAVTDNIIKDVENYLIQENIIFKIIPYIHYNKEIQQQYKGKAILNTASKISILNFDEYDKIIFLDGDTIVYKNIDELFSYPDGAMLNEYGKALSGLMVLTPKNHNVGAYYTLLQLFPILDGDLFDLMLFPFKSNSKYRIPDYYFINITLESLDEINLNNIYCVQFCYQYKPWFYNSADEYCNDFLNEFNNYSNQNRMIILKHYFENYLLPLINKYPQIKDII